MKNKTGAFVVALPESEATRRRGGLARPEPSLRGMYYEPQAEALQHCIVIIPSRHSKQKAVSEEEYLSDKFQRLAKQWRKETRHLSSITALSMNKSYQQIIGMGKDALPFILQDLQKTHDYWLWALNAIVDDNPAESAEDSNEAIAAWLAWGVEQGHL